MKKILSFLICISILLPMIVTGCDNSNEKPEPVTTQSSTEGSDDPNRLSKVNIVTGESGTEVYAGAELKKYLKKKDVESADNGVLILVFIDEEMEDDSYTVFSNEEGLTIKGGNGRGVLYGVYRFLEEYGGIRFFTPTLEVIPDSDIILDDVNIEYTPVFKRRTFDWYPARNSEEWMAKNGINDCAWYGTFSSARGGSWNSGNIAMHSIGILTGTGDHASPNPCLTDPENLEKAIASVRQALQSDPGIASISVSQNDNNSYCRCENCAAIDEEEGSPAGTMLRFVNAVAADISKDYPNVVIETLAYNYTQTPPSITKPLPNVAVRLCSIRCHFTHPLSDDKCGSNTTFKNDLMAWGEICDNVYVWDYTTNYRYSIPTFANFKVLRENMRFFADNNVTGMFPEGNYFSASGEFGELRAYLLAKLMQDPYMTEQEYNTHMNEFLQAYYGEGWTYIRDYIRSISTEAAYGCQSIYGDPFAAVSESYYRAMETDFDSWWDKAEKMAEDRLGYVKRSRLQWRYIQLMLHPNAEEAKEFVADVTKAGIAWGEGDLKELPDNVDLSQPPNKWFTFTWWLD